MPTGFYERPSLAERFFQKLEKTNGCWNWTATITPNGYGQIGVGYLLKHAHRVSWEIHNGKIPGGLLVLHKCDNKKCVRPSHLFLGNHSENMLDMYKKGRGRTNFAKGTRHGSAKLDEADVISIRKEYSNKKTTHSLLAKKYRVNKSTIGGIVRRKIWKHI